MSTYIKKEDAIALLDRYNIRIEMMDDLPSISFEEMIKEKLKMCKAQASDSERHFGGMVVCEQLLNKLHK